MIVFLIINRNYRICALIAFGCVILGIYFIINPEQFPRIEKLVDIFSVRIKTMASSHKRNSAHPYLDQDQ